MEEAEACSGGEERRKREEGRKDGVSQWVKKEAERTGHATVAFPADLKRLSIRSQCHSLNTTVSAFMSSRIHLSLFERILPAGCVRANLAFSECAYEYSRVPPLAGP